jgi:YVTN family beta-propeller protein
MQAEESKRSYALRARGLVALWAMLAMAAVFGAPPAEAAPFAYVASEADGTVSVIDTAINKLVVTVPRDTIPIVWPSLRMGNMSMSQI